MSDVLFQSQSTALLPELILAAVACFLFVAGTFQSSRVLTFTLADAEGKTVFSGFFQPNRMRWGVITLLTLVIAGIVALVCRPAAQVEQPYIAPLALDHLAYLVKLMAIGGGILLVLLSWDQGPERFVAEQNACLLLIVAGMSLTGCANDLVMLFLALELISIPTYVILYLPKYDRGSQEAATKYFLLSVFSSGFLLFGFSYLYGLAGTTNIPALMHTLYLAGADKVPPIARIALVMTTAGLGFKITAVPFHFYAPDVYQGTTPPLAAMLAYVPKVAGFVSFFRVLGLVWGGYATNGLELGDQAPMLFYILAAVTMSLGNLLALLQDNLRRLLAYSSVAHAGYMIIGLAVAHSLRARDDVGGVDAILFYLVAYGSMTIGAFAVITYLSTPERPVETVDDLAGLSKSHPSIALIMCVFLFSLIGIPFTAGFAGKLLLFMGAMFAQAKDHPWLFTTLALVAGLNAAVGGWYYLRIIAAMYLRTSVKPLEQGRSLPVLASIGLCSLVTILFGVWPNLLLEPAKRASHRPSPPALEARAER